MNSYYALERKLIFSLPFLFASQFTFAQFKTIRSDEGIELQERGTKVLFFQVKPKYVDGKYERAGYIHPLYSLKGNSITDDSPKDHPYHRGIFWAWHQLLLNDFSLGDGWVSQNISYLPVK